MTSCTSLLTLLTRTNAPNEVDMLTILDFNLAVPTTVGFLRSRFL